MADASPNSFQEKTCANCYMKFEITEIDGDLYKRFEVPHPTWCPSCRHIRRHGHINDYVFYSRTCDCCKKDFVSTFPQSSPYVVYCQSCWYSEKRDDKAQGHAYDHTQSFFIQFDRLMHEAPQLGIVGQNNVNSDYCQSVANCKNTYLIAESSNCEDCYYCYWIQKTSSSLDCSYAHECERCYQIVDCRNCYNLKYSLNCWQCRDSAFLDSCIGCDHCLFSVNLRHKQYHIFNKPYSKEEYFQKSKELQYASSSAQENSWKQFFDFLQTQPRKYLHIDNVENSFGDYLWNAKNCRHVFHCYEAEDCAYGEHIWRGAKDCVDSNTAGREAELLYETTNSGINSYNIKFSRYCWGCHNTEYSSQCKNGKYLFGCVSLKPGAEYCVLNKQYSKAEWEQLVKEIKQKMLKDGEYGEFFPLSISLFGFNNSVSYDELPLSREETKKRGWKWEEESSGTFGKGTMSFSQVGEEISSVNDTICNEVLSCESCRRNFRIIKAELTFYHQEQIPIPRKCPHCRHRKRLSLRNPKHFWDRHCDRCDTPLKSSYSPQHAKSIYCEQCYLQLVS